MWRMLEQVPDSRLGLLAQVCLQVFFCLFDISLLKKIFEKKVYYLTLTKSWGWVPIQYNLAFLFVQNNPKEIFFSKTYNIPQLIFVRWILFWFQPTLFGGKFDAFCLKPQEGRSHTPQSTCKVLIMSSFCQKLIHSSHG